eukprot:GHVU01161621.1.p1 GENE.GHVU01161621.1~~GHVU01161621.1.p1  ORF type:complete len:167 (+),score=33.52 GHVU01161621.1:229-729(+)
MFKDGTRVVSLSSVASHMHVDRLGPVMRAKLLSDMPIEDWERLIAEYEKTYEAVAKEGGGMTPHLHEPTGFWLQSYGFSKAVLDGITRRWAKDLSPKYLFFACHPGFIATGMTNQYEDFKNLKNAEQGATSSVKAILDADILKHTGCHIGEDGTPVQLPTHKGAAT